ncbi:hypothetical protein DPMN_055408 [Dreissena polymorpha]|uniref:Uncharacterized protein n=1 Tax=Dreissena polymorpha TaxID=45954 RepID=A0A9D4CQR0_DREPO|nr:hypothetical protein DPMN_055408 [Dreissena polymorpha]
METELCLVVRDGLDEWMAPDGSDLVEPSMVGFPKDKRTVLTTSRPWKLADERIKNSQIDILLEIEGISDPDTFSKNILRCIIDETNDLLKAVKEFETFVKHRKLESLLSLPMLHTHVICTWVDRTDKKRHLEETSLCLLYTTFIESLCKTANCTDGYFKESNPSHVKCFWNTCYIQPNHGHIYKLAEAAFKLLFSYAMETSIVFSDQTLSNFCHREEFTVFKKFALISGIITSRKNKKSVRLLEFVYLQACAGFPRCVSYRL